MKSFDTSTLQDEEKIVIAISNAVASLKAIGIQKQEIANTINVKPFDITKAKDYKYPMSIKKRKKILADIIKKYNLFFDQNIETIDHNSLSHLQELAARLALNLADFSTNSITTQAKHGEILIEKFPLNYSAKGRKRERFIMLIGAGASYVATKGAIPITQEASEQVINKVTSNPTIKGLIKEEIQILHQIYGIPPQSNNFEITLMACSKFKKKELLIALQEICGIKYLHSLSYDIIAHLFKHRFIDVIFNFNFDEILNEAIEEEIAGSDWHYIYSDGHCPTNPEADFLIERRLKKPIYIKPHGTIQYKDSLKFTPEDYVSAPDDIQNTMYQVVSCKVDAEGADVQLPVNFIVVGFGMQSPKFLKLVRDFDDKCDEQMKFWIIDKKTSLEEFNLPKDIYEIIKRNHSFIKTKDGKKELDHIFQELWSEVISNFKENVKPKGISRHLLLHSIFRKDTKSKISKRGDKEHRKDYLKKRFYVELIIALLKSDGILNFQQIYEGKYGVAGKYFRLYKEIADRSSFSIEQACKEIGLKRYKGFNPDTFIHKHLPEFINNDETIFDNLANNLKGVLSRITPTNYSETDLEIWKDYMKRMKSEHRLKITPKFNNPHYSLFPNVVKKNILHTSVRWLNHFRGFLKNRINDWDLTLTISEQGRSFKRHLKDNPEYFEGKKAEIILASYDSEDFDSRQLYKFEGLDMLSNEPLLLPWWQHQRHFVLFLKRRKNRTTGDRKNDWKLVKGFYYKSPLLSRCVNPFYTENDKDLEVLLEIFAKYWYKANHYTESLNNNEDFNTTRIIKNEKIIETTIQKILDMYDDKMKASK